MLMQQNRIEWLASLRGLLVLLVFASHLPLFINISSDFAFVLGRMGVAGFFVISGYLAVSSIEKRNAKQYLFNRFLRIYPIFWLLLICVYLLSSNGFTITDLVKNMALASKSMIGSSWMLPIMVFMFVCLTCIHKLKVNIDAAYIALMVFSLLLGLCRWYTGVKLPTAFFLLSALGVLSYRWKMCECNLQAVRWQIVVYETVLLMATALSYQDKMPWYFLAYNLGGYLYTVQIQKHQMHMVGVLRQDWFYLLPRGKHTYDDGFITGIRLKAAKRYRRCCFKVCTCYSILLAYHTFLGTTNVEMG